MAMPLSRLRGIGRAVLVFGWAAATPSNIPSALIGHPAPQTALPPLEGLVNGGARKVPGLDPAVF